MSKGSIGGSSTGTTGGVGYNFMEDSVYHEMYFKPGESIIHVFINYNPRYGKKIGYSLLYLISKDNVYVGLAPDLLLSDKQIIDSVKKDYRSILARIQ